MALRKQPFPEDVPAAPAPWAWYGYKDTSKRLLVFRERMATDPQEGKTRKRSVRCTVSGCGRLRPRYERMWWQANERGTWEMRLPREAVCRIDHGLPPTADAEVSAADSAFLERSHNFSGKPLHQRQVGVSVATVVSKSSAREWLREQEKA